MKVPTKILSLSLIATLVFTACKKDETAPETPTDPSSLPLAYQKFNADIEIIDDGDFWILRSEGIPDHKSPYYPTNSSMYEAYNGNNPQWHKNPNTIATQNFEFRIPKNPSEAQNKAATPMGAIGISLNGVAFYNQYAAGNAPLTNEINSFDQYQGHPQFTGQYHYHIEPTYLTQVHGQDAFLGFLLDGFPVYGPMENGQQVSNSDLDAYHGHTHATTEYPNGIYHYHITDADPYLNGDGFFGTAGTVSQ